VNLLDTIADLVENEEIQPGISQKHCNKESMAHLASSVNTLIFLFNINGQPFNDHL
jgi:hypothetical protein